MSSSARLCAGCNKALPPKHLRTQLAPPDSAWRELRTHDLECLLEALDAEYEANGAGRIFKRPEHVGPPLPAEASVGT